MLDFLGIGAQKCATTWLFENLKKHPQLHFPQDIKEHHFWNRFDPQNVSALQSYQNSFSAEYPGVQGEITPAYAILDIKMIEIIYNLYPKLKLLYIIRDPIDRAWFSALMALERAGMSLEEASDNWFIDHFHSQGSLRRGDYRTCIKNWLSVFPSEQFCLLDYKDICHSPLAVLQQCCRHLNVDPTFFTQTILFTNTIFPLRSTLTSSLNTLYNGYLRDPLEWLSAPPIVIGGTGGSGTRVVRKILQLAGAFMATHCNIEGDSYTFEPLLDQYINPILQETSSVNYSLSQCSAQLKDELLFSLKEAILTLMLQSPDPTSRWGWKNPRSAYLLPYIYHFFPKMYFIHVIRDGRDIAFSNNQNQCNKHYQAYFGASFDSISLPEASIQLWSKMNLDLAKWAQEHLGSRYIPILFETLCENPKEVIQSLLFKLDISIEDATMDTLMQAVASPSSLYRWKNQAPKAVAQLESIGEAGLRHFNYLTT